ncbi:MAG: YcgN family cysteine cluster protein [Pseudomonadota bacterium]
MAEPFWTRNSLEEMSPEEWEALCDGCGRCCLNKLEDADTGEIAHTNVACALFDAGTCRCKDYARRTETIPDCVQLTPEDVRTLPWLPATCAYRLLAEGEPLRWWHPLVSGDAQTVHLAGVSVRGRTVSEEDVAVEDYERFIVDWVDEEPD